MRILHLIANDVTQSSHSRFLDLALTLASIGLEQHVLTFQDKTLIEEMESNGLSHEVVKFGGLFDLQTANAVERALDAFAPHIVHSYTPAAAYFYPANNRTAVHIGLWDPGENGERPQNCGIVAVPSYNAAYDVPSPGAALENYEIPPLVRPDTGTAPLNRADFGIPAKAFLIGAMAQFNENESLKPILRALREIPDSFFLIAGKGPDRSSIEEIVVRQNIGDKVRILDEAPGRYGFLKMLDACVVPARKEGTEYLTLEAWAARIPVVSASRPERTPLKDGENGLCVTQDDPLAWREAISRLQSSEALRVKMAEAGFMEFNDRFYPSRTIVYYLNLYKNALPR